MYVNKWGRLDEASEAPQHILSYMWCDPNGVDRRIAGNHRIEQRNQKLASRGQNRAYSDMTQIRIMYYIQRCLWRFSRSGGHSFGARRLKFCMQLVLNIVQVGFRAFFEIRIFFFENSKKLFFFQNAIVANLIELETSTWSQKMRNQLPSIPPGGMKGLGPHLHTPPEGASPPTKIFSFLALAPPFLRNLKI